MPRQNGPPSLVERVGISPEVHLAKRDYPVIQPGYWFNQYGSFVAKSDASSAMVETMTNKLKDGEALVALQEETLMIPSISSEPNRSNLLLHRNANNPGIKFLSENFSLLILPRVVYLPGKDGSHADLIAVNRKKVNELPTISSKLARLLLVAVETA